MNEHFLDFLFSQKVSLPGKNKIWFFWDTDLSDAPEIVKLSYSNWRQANPEYDVVLLNKENCENKVGFNFKIFENATGQKVELGDDWMEPSELAKLMLNILKLPKNMEVSEITINRK